MNGISLYQKYAALRDKKGMTDYAVAKETNLSRSLFSEWKAQVYTPKVDKLIVIADYFGVSIEYFLSGEGK